MGSDWYEVEIGVSRRDRVLFVVSLCPHARFEGGALNCAHSSHLTPSDDQAVDASLLMTAVCVLTIESFKIERNERFTTQEPTGISR